MRDHDIEPDVGFDLAEDVGMCARRDALDGRLDFGEGLEKVDNALADADLFSLLVDVHLARIEKVDLAVSEFLFRWLVRSGRHQSWVHDED